MSFVFLTFFSSGEREKKCTVLLMGDNLYEPDEQFRIVLGDPRTGAGLQAMIGGLNESVITVHDFGDSKFQINLKIIKQPC